MKLLKYSTVCFILLFCFSCKKKQKFPNEILELNLKLNSEEITAENNLMIRAYKPNKIGYSVKLEIKNTSDKTYGFDMYTCSFGAFLMTNSEKLQILDVLGCDSNFPTEIKLKPNEKIVYKFLILKDKNAIENFNHVKIGLTIIHTNWALEKSLPDQIEEQRKSRSKKIFWSNSIDLN
ncbi:hypothetical protein [Chryseobacterium taeanense]|uniref:hypothetical protein n=1 Tax=Chryseobacterium taeanense TaxID=311334 RepID=UPI0035B46ACC